MQSGQEKYVGAIDQGTTSTRFVLVDKDGQIMGMHQQEHAQHYPRAGWVEHDPIEVRDNAMESIRRTLDKTGVSAEEIAALGITNQRETTVVWNPRTGRPYANAIVWQDTRTSDLCRELSRGGDLDCFREKVGLPLATYFSGPKIRWILDNVDGAREAAERGEALFGTMDSWLTWWLTGGPAGGIHVTDVTNASRTMLMDLETLSWDGEMLKTMSVPAEMLPEIKPSSGVIGYTQSTGVFGREIPVAGVLGDQQAALFGQGCFAAGDAKNTYGTGCFLLLNTGGKIVQSGHGLITTVGYKIGEEDAVYALEGSVAIAGSLVQWIRDNLGLIAESAEIERLARTVDTSGGVYFVPAFSGLFAPHWRSDARGVIAGLTHFVNKGHLARAVLEASAYQTADIFEAMQKDSGIDLNSLKVDGGMVVNELLMRFQADILGVKVIRPQIVETTVLGAAYAAGLAVGFWRDQAEIKSNWREDRTWAPAMGADERRKLRAGWGRAVEKSFS